MKKKITGKQILQKGIFVGEIENELYYYFYIRNRVYKLYALTKGRTKRKRPITRDERAKVESFLLHNMNEYNKKTIERLILKKEVLKNEEK